ncbi:hypothetical protein [Kineosporia succinea]|uniref:Sugar lactone lactonase YvrE n=1 Tax=Kineosporia succinea TaxID=84632 RepID=A0ABT9PCX4_9ACTN|nr:hypothetical protein [Kineosporia succinea]MDP9830341.1 sugar lactone lactonase YvrE [Kineosporia succinea]
MSSSITRLAAAAAVVASASAAALLNAVPAEAFSPPLTSAGIRVHFDLAGGQMPENVVTDRNGSVAVTLAGARQVARVSSRGEVRVLATLPAPKDPRATTPLLGFPLTSGLVRDGRTFYVAYATGSRAETGIWTFEEGRRPRKIADLPASGLPNGMVMDHATKTLYVTDSVRGVVYSVGTRGTVTTFSTDPALTSTGFFGVNGAKIRAGRLYVSNLDRGTVLSSPLRGRGAGTFTTEARDLQGIDDFAFTGKGEQLIASLVTENKVVLVDGPATTTILTGDDGLSNPSAVAVRGDTVYVTNAAYTTQKDPNLLVAHLGRP